MASDLSLLNARTVLEKIESKDIAFGRTVVPVPNRNKEIKKDKLGFEFAEHCFIGDAITLTLATGEKVAASDHKFQLGDQLRLTYGQINGLAGDFYGTADPISDGSDEKDQSARFLRAYNTLANGGSRQPKEAEDILGVLQAEVDAVNNALANHEDPSVAYSQLPDVTLKLEWITTGRSGPTYLGLSQINWDHFGADARTAYNAGHATAIQKAISGDLEGAYTLNAFADHFLEDSFSAGHLRTPRRLLHRSNDPTADLCAKLMHDEDNAIGISVKNPAGQSWPCYGDKRALDCADKDNEKRCVDSVQASADEIYKAYQTKQAPLPADYQAWTHAPTLESARAHDQTLVTLFTFENERRKEIKNRRQWNFKKDWWFWSTASECELSGWWNYPITINGLQSDDGAQNIVPWSSVAVTTPKQGDVFVFYQSSNSDILKSEHRDGSWAGGIGSSPIFKAVLFTPLAAINFNEGKEVRVYYLDEQYLLQEYCYSAKKGHWFPGELGNMKVKAATNTSIAAIQYSDNQGGVHIRLYCQELASNVIQELCHDGNWSRGAVLPAALSGSSLAATTYWHNGLNIRLYYQTDDLTIKEHCLNNGGWVSGELNVGKAPGCVSISALSYVTGDGSVEISAYWRNLQNEIVVTKNTGSWGSINTVAGDLKPGTRFAAAQWSDGKNLRVYFQNPDHAVLEMCHDGDSWSGGANVGNPH